MSCAAFQVRFSGGFTVALKCKSQQQIRKLNNKSENTTANQKHDNKSENTTANQKHNRKSENTSANQKTQQQSENTTANQKTEQQNTKQQKIRKHNIKSENRTTKHNGKSETQQQIRKHNNSTVLLPIEENNIYLSPYTQISQHGESQQNMSAVVCITLLSQQTTTNIKYCIQYRLKMTKELSEIHQRQVAKLS